MVAEFHVGGSEDKPSVELFVVEDCLRSRDSDRHPLRVTSSKSGYYCCSCYSPEALENDTQ